MSFGLSQVPEAFGAERAVQDVSLEIAPGEFFAVLGPSGCGKSTLLRLIAGLERADSGAIRIAGRTVADADRHAPPEQRDVGVVFQSYALWPHMSVQDNVAFPIESAGESGAAARDAARRHLETVELDRYAARRPAELSGGQRQRVALARCLAQNAATVLMDEPLANLDPHLRAAMEVELSRFHERAGATVLYITHDQREAMALADRLAVMWQGRLLQVAAPDEIYRRPANERVARFIGRAAVVPAEIVSVDGKDASVSLAGVKIVAACDGKSRPGPVTVVIRPDDIVAEGEGALTGRVERAVYRGGTWEASVTADGLREPVEVSLDRRVAKGEALPLSIRSAWVLPEG